MSNKLFNKWWEQEENIYLSDTITFKTWFDVMRDWDSWRENGTRMYFRGESACLNEDCTTIPNEQPDKSLVRCEYNPYPLLPSLLRDHNFSRLQESWKSAGNDAKKIERLLLDHYIRHTAHLIESEGQFAGRTLADLEILCLAQHYGLPTRLLDWTLNPFIALYFALAGSWRRGNFNADEPARLWVMILKNEKERSDRTIHLERKKQKDNYLDKVVDLDIEGGLQDWFEVAPFIVVPLVFTQRIAAQSGRFIYCSNLNKSHANSNGNNNRLDKIITKHILPKSKQNKDIRRQDCIDGLDGLLTSRFFFNDKKQRFEQNKESEFNNEIEKYPWKHLICYPIEHGKNKWDMLNQLEFRGYHAGHLFPDLGGWATYLQQGFR